jgi:hypothetical protein
MSDVMPPILALRDYTTLLARRRQQVVKPPNDFCERARSSPATVTRIQIGLASPGPGPLGFWSCRLRTAPN